MQEKKYSFQLLRGRGARSLVAHVHQAKAWPVPHACTQPYRQGSGSDGQLFCPYLGSAAWHSRRVNERGKSPCVKDPLLPR